MTAEFSIPETERILSAYSSMISKINNDLRSIFFICSADTQINLQTQKTLPDFPNNYKFKCLLFQRTNARQSRSYEEVFDPSACSLSNYHWCRPFGRHVLCPGNLPLKRKLSQSYALEDKVSGQTHRPQFYASDVPGEAKRISRMELYQKKIHTAFCLLLEYHFITPGSIVNDWN